jgi:integrase/recombinase XerD
LVALFIDDQRMLSSSKMADRAESSELVTVPPAGVPTSLPLPAAAVIVLRQTPNAAFAAEEFFKASLSNEHTRRAYGRIAGRFLSWCDDRGFELRQVTPGLAGEYISQLAGSTPTRNQVLAALRHFFDALNHFASMRGIKYSVTEGKTAELAIEQARKLFKSIDTGHIVGLRDRAVLGVLAYTGARIGAVAKLRIADYRNLGDHRVLRFREKVGKDREIPVRHDLALWLNEYIAAAGIAEDDGKMPLFRGAAGKRKRLTSAGYSAHSMRQMMKRRLEDAGLPDLFSPHSFRVTVVTDLPNQNVPLEDVQYLAGHASPTTTRVYDRRRRKVTRNIVERISI